MLANYNLAGVDSFLPSIVRFHELPAQTAAIQPQYTSALSFHQQTTAHQALEALRQLPSDIDDVYYLFVTDSQEKLVGVVTLRQLICAPPGARLFEFMDRWMITLPHDASLEQQAHLMSESRLLALPVVDEKGRLVGAMDASDLIHAMQHESTAEMYHLAGISKDETLSQPAAARSTYRLLWLAANLLIAFSLAWIIHSFGSLLASFMVLAAFLPLVTRIGMQASGQTLTLLVRSIKLGQLPPSSTRQLVSRELLGGLLNGLLIGGLAGFGCWLVQGQAILGVIVAVAVLAAILVASLAGVGVPLACRALKLDPSRAATITVSALADVCGIICLLELTSLAMGMGYL